MLAELKAQVINHGGVVRDVCHRGTRYYWADTHEPLEYDLRVTFENTFTVRTHAVNNPFAQGTVSAEFNRHFMTTDEQTINGIVRRTYMPIDTIKDQSRWRLPRLRRQ